MFFFVFLFVVSWERSSHFLVIFVQVASQTSVIFIDQQSS